MRYAMRDSPGLFSARRGNAKGSVISGSQAMVADPYSGAAALHLEADETTLQMIGVVGDQQHFIEGQFQDLGPRHAGLRRREAPHRDADNVRDAGDLVDTTLDRAAMQRLTESPLVGVEEAVTAVRRPVVGELLLEHETNVLAPIVRVCADH